MTETTSTDAAVEEARQRVRTLSGFPLRELDPALEAYGDLREQRGREQGIEGHAAMTGPVIREVDNRLTAALTRAEQAEAAAAGLRGALERLADWHGRINAVEFAAKYPELSRQLDSLAREYPEGNYSEAELQALGVAAALDATQGAGLVAELEALKALRDAVAKMPADKTPLDVYEAWSTADEYESVRKEAQ